MGRKQLIIGVATLALASGVYLMYGQFRAPFDTPKLAGSGSVSSISPGATSKPAQLAEVPEPAPVSAASKGRQRTQQAHAGRVPVAQLPLADQLLLLQSQLAQGDKGAVSVFHIIVSARPAGQWPANLVDAKLCGQVVSLAREQILAKPQDANAVSDAQEVVAEALALEGNATAALPEAKKFFNVATLKTTSRAISLVADLLSKTGGTAAAFRQQQIAGADTAGQLRIPTTSPSVLASIMVDPFPYAGAIEKAKSEDSYDNLLARGNLSLLSGDVQSGQECFQLAAQAAGKGGGKKLTVAIEGMLRSIRDQAGGIGLANSVARSLRLGNPDPSYFPADSFDPSSLQDAAKHMDQAALPAEFLGGNGASTAVAAARVQPSTPAKYVGADRALLDPVDIAKSAPVPDVALAAWLENWRNEKAKGAGVSPEERDRLRSILGKTTETSIQLFPMAHAIHLRAPDDLATPAILYQAASVAAEKELPTLGKGQASLDVLHAMNDHMQDYKDVLWPAVFKSPADAVALATMYRIYSNMVQWNDPGDPALAKTFNHVTLGMAECLHFQGDYEKAIGVLNEVHGRTMTSVEAEYDAWFLGEAQFKLERYAEALPHFKEVAEIKDDPVYARCAHEMAVRCLAMLGRVADAKAELEVYRSRYNSDSSQVGELGVLIRSAEIAMSTP